MAFLEIGKNISIDTHNDFPRVPGYMLTGEIGVEEDNTISLKFDNASQEDSPAIHYSIFQESSVQEIEEYDLSLSLDMSSYDSGGSNRTPRYNASDARYYTVTFPDDFVGEKESESDPFRERREESGGQINARCDITLIVPAQMDISGNGIGTFINSSTSSSITHDHRDPSGNPYVRGDYTYGPVDSIGRAAYNDRATTDPCIILNLDTTEWTQYALEGLNITIENYGNTIGAGGFGGYGTSWAEPVGKFDQVLKQYASGGGGGGAGHHPAPIVRTFDNPTRDKMDAYEWSYGSSQTPLTSANTGVGGEGYAGSTGWLTAAFGTYAPYWFGYDGAPGGTDFGGAGGSYNTNRTFPIAWNTLNPVDKHPQGYTYAGHGGTCVFLHCNTTVSTSGVKLTIINKEGAKFISGGGGGGGGHNQRDGSDGGNLGEPGDSSSSGLSGNELKEWGRYGEAGKVVWWSSDNLQTNYILINESTKPDTLKGWDDSAASYIS